MSKGIVLRHLNGEGPIEVMTRVRDFNIQQVAGPKGPMEIPADTLVTFTAQTFRELGASDEWEFVTMVPSSGGPVKAYVYVNGTDIFLIRAMSKVA